MDAAARGFGNCGKDDPILNHLDFFRLSFVCLKPSRFQNNARMFERNGALKVQGYLGSLRPESPQFSVTLIIMK